MFGKYFFRRWSLDLYWIISTTLRILFCLWMKNLDQVLLIVRLNLLTLLVHLQKKVTSYLLKHIIYMQVLFRRSLEKKDTPQLLHQFQSILFLHSSLRLKVTLSPHQYLDCLLWICVSLKFPHPFLHIRKWLSAEFIIWLLCNGIGKYHSIHLPVIWFYETIVGLLACSIEYIEPHFDFVYDDSFILEVDTDGDLPI